MSWFQVSLLVDRLITISAVDRTADKGDVAGLTPHSGTVISDFSDQLFDFAGVLTIGKAVKVFPNQAVICEKIPVCPHRIADRVY
jgi:hypothetical protein